MAPGWGPTSMLGEGRGVEGMGRLDGWDGDVGPRCRGGAEGDGGAELGPGARGGLGCRCVSGWMEMA